MRVLVFHGYLLRGTGSNIYNASLARALAGMGHEVHLLCQDRDAGELEWVSAVGGWTNGGLEVQRLRDPGGPGLVTVYVPDIGGVLPVYVKDTYPGFEAKAFPELSDAELDRYLEANVAAVRDVVAAAGEPDAALANHLVMGPLVLARALGGGGFAAKVHGSALEYTVKPNPRFLPHAKEGAEAAEGILVGSRHTAESLWAALPDLGLEEKTRLGPPGVDLDEFSPAQAGARSAVLETLAGRIEAGGGEEAFGRDRAAAAAALGDVAVADGPLVVFVGKLILSKGVDLLLAAWPLVRSGHPDARLLMVGFGGWEEGAQRMVAALDRGDADELRELARAGRGLEGGPAEPLPILSRFLDDPPPGYLEAGRGSAPSVSFAGRLEHEEVAELLPHADALVMPSTFPEAFGMVAVEAASCGVLPISAAHSGMREVSLQLAPVLPEELRELISFEVAPGAVEALGGRVERWLAVPPPRRREVGAALRARVAELWSWEAVAEGVIAGARGELERLPSAD
jgi:glycosyltransferase involved in cell wall biosynthesis